MNLEILSALLARELRTLRREVEAYPDDQSLWTRSPGITNTGGALVHHVTGNLRHFIGALLGDTGYVRDRAGEFSRTDLGRSELMALVDATQAEVADTLAGLDPAKVESEYPVVVGGYLFGTGEFLMHLLSHLAYHLGQIDYHRRMVTSSSDPVGAVATGEIPGARAAT